jgi:hypothetical protein
MASAAPAIEAKLNRSPGKLGILSCYFLSGLFTPPFVPLQDEEVSQDARHRY